MRSVYISILNWNDASSTLRCVQSVSSSIVPDDVSVTVFVQDNGSSLQDWAVLQSGLKDNKPILIRQEKNTGFAAGHNVVIRQAIEQGIDFIWLLNNDAVVRADTLAGLLLTIADASDCGAVSPLIYAHHDEKIVDFVGAIHDWKRLEPQHAKDPAAAKAMQTNNPRDFFVFGTAPLFRVAALRAVGLLNEDLFAYYEDTELSARLSKSGWTSQMGFSVTIQHFRRKDTFTERPPYFFYLMTRNALLFYLRHTPPEYRRWIRLRLFCRAMITAANLRQRGLLNKSDACLLGILHGLLGKAGPPQLDRLPPFAIILISNFFPYRLQQWLEK